MKAEITSYGCLRIIAESAIESYALIKWFKDYNAEAESEASLQIVPIQDEDARIGE